MTNVFYYSRNQQYDFISGEYSSEREKLECELDRMEAELNYSLTQDGSIPGPLLMDKSEQLSSVRALRARLGQQSITDVNFHALKNEIGQLRVSVEKYVLGLNEALRVSRLSNSSKKRMESSSEKFISANRHTPSPSISVQKGTTMMTSSMQLLTFRNAANDKSKKENRAKRADFLKMEVNFAENELSNGNYAVYARVLDPTGNLILDRRDSSGKIASSNLQYSAKWNIDFLNDGRQYVLDWKPSQGFIPGTYLVLLYNEQGTNMGEASVLLK